MYDDILNSIGFREVAKYNNIFYCIYNHLVKYINSRYDVNCSMISRNSIIDKLVTTKTEERYKELMYDYFCSPYIYFIFNNIDRYRREISNSLVEAFGLRFVEDKDNQLIFKTDRKNFETLYGLFKMCN